MTASRIQDEFNAESPNIHRICNSEGNIKQIKKQEKMIIYRFP